MQLGDIAKEQITGPELISPQVLFAPSGRYVRSYVTFPYSFKSGGVLIAHDPEEKHVIAGVVNDNTAFVDGGDRKHFVVGIKIENQVHYNLALKKLEKVGRGKEKPSKKDYKLEEKISLGK